MLPVSGQSVSVLHAFATQCPDAISHVSSGEQLPWTVQDGMHEPVLPFIEHAQMSPGLHTIACCGAASPAGVQSLSVAHGLCGVTHVVQVLGRHVYDCGQSLWKLHVRLPPPSAIGEGPLSPAHEILLCWTLHTPFVHVAVVAQS